MASVYLKNGRWYLRIKDKDGRWRDRATSARTKAEANRIAGEIERKLERQAVGLEPDDTGAEMTVAQLMEWYCATYLADRPSFETVSASTRLHIVPAIGHLRLGELRAGHIETLLQAKVRELAPQTINHLRGYLLRALNKAKKAGKWSGSNVAIEVERPASVGDGARPLEAALCDRRLHRHAQRRAHRSAQVRRGSRQPADHRAQII
jgi:integrase